MNFRKKNQISSVPAPPEEAAEQLFEKISRELDIHPREKRRRRNYRAEAAFIYAAPKIAALLLVMAALLLLLATARIPSTVTDLVRTPTAAGERISFSVTRPIMVSGVSASLNGRSLPVVQEEHGYWVHVEENGSLQLDIRSVLGSVWSTQLLVTGIDNETPHIVRHETAEEDVRIYLTDGEDGSGIDWASISAHYAGSGLAYPLKSVDEAESSVLLAVPDSEITVLVPDLAENVLNISIIPGSGG